VDVGGEQLSQEQPPRRGGQEPTQGGGVEDGDPPPGAAPFRDEAGGLQVGGGPVHGQREHQERRGPQEWVAVGNEDGLVGSRVGQQRLHLARPGSAACRPFEQGEVVVAQVLEPAIHLPARYHWVRSSSADGLHR
jgi:hypothetical protein